MKEVSRVEIFTAKCLRLWLPHKSRPLDRLHSCRHLSHLRSVHKISNLVCSSSDLGYCKPPLPRFLYRAERQSVKSQPRKFTREEILLLEVSPFSRGLGVSKPSPVLFLPRYILALESTKFLFQFPISFY